MTAAQEGPQLSKAAQSLWGKSDYGEEREWLPLFMHMYDSKCVAERLWDTWVPDSTQSTIRRGLGPHASFARDLFVFLASIHDLGKATPCFQAMPCHRNFAGVYAGPKWKAERAGLTLPPSSSKHAPGHPVAGQVILQRILAGQGVPGRARSLTSILGSHHGSPPEKLRVSEAEHDYPTDLGQNDANWKAIQSELVEYALAISGLSWDALVSIARVFLPPQVTCLLTGLVIMVDWMASDQDAFPLLAIQDGEGLSFYIREGRLDEAEMSRRFKKAWASIDILPCWHGRPLAGDVSNSLYARRFAFPRNASPRPMQRAVLDVAQKLGDPGLMIIEAPMGEGKTEAALAAAEVFARASGCGGVCIALPTMATTDAMFSRVHAWLQHLPQANGRLDHSIYLAHGKARLNEEYRGIARGSSFSAIGQDIREKGESPEAVVCDWMYGRKRGVLANFVVCTIDQVLMSALQMKHLALRQLALANKVVIIDECHAYDAYMREYLRVALEWMGSWHTPVILLSATLPEAQREEMARSYLKGWRAEAGGREGGSGFSLGRRRPPDAAQPKHREEMDIPKASESAYPLVTYTNGSALDYLAVAPSARKLEAELALVADDVDLLVELLNQQLEGGGCAGVVCDTVSRAQEAATALRAAFGRDRVSLTHARFTDIDRMENEQAIRSILGPDATRANGRRLDLHIVVGTQVLEQSLDLDFDVLVTDVAPTDLLFQRLGRVHRHVRDDRPAGLQNARCFVRGIEGWEEGGPRFVPEITRVYERASLLEALSVMGLRNEGTAVQLTLPADISRMVRQAYGEEAAADMPPTWRDAYGLACEDRSRHIEEKRRRTSFCLLRSVEDMCRNEDTLVGMYNGRRSEAQSAMAGGDYDSGPRAVRDTQETLEVVVLRRGEDGIRLLPWIGDEAGGVEPGAKVTTNLCPSDAVAKVAAQSVVRLPLSVCPPTRIEDVIRELEKEDGPYVGAWQESPWLAGQLVLFFEEDAAGALVAHLDGRCLTYSREMGLQTETI